MPEEFSQELELAPPSEPLPYDLHNLRRLTLLNIEMQETVNRGFKLLEEGKINYDSLKKIYVEAIHRLREAFGEHLEMMEETSENDSSP